MTINDGWPAFPVPNDANVNNQRGMSLRDYFAAAALQGILAGAERIDDAIGGGSIPNTEHNAAAGDAYFYADAMLRERERKPE